MRYAKANRGCSVNTCSLPPRGPEGMPEGMHFALQYQVTEAPEEVRVEL